MPLLAPNTNPDVVPQPLRGSSGVWGFVAGALASIVEILPAVEPLVQGAWKAWIPVIAFAAGVVLNKITQDAPYVPVPPPKPPPPTDDLDARIALAVQAALKAAAASAPPKPAP